MKKFVIAPHMRLQEWVAVEKGYFDSEGLDYILEDQRHGDKLSRCATAHHYLQSL